MKLTDQDVPTEMVGPYKELISTKGGIGGGTKTAATRKKARKPKKKKTPVGQRKIYEYLIENLAKLWGRNKDDPADRQWRYDRIQELNAGDPPDTYWRELMPLDEYILSASPDSINDDDPPDYDYRIDTNLPTIPTYPDGEYTVGLPRYTGARTGSRFYDEVWKWRRRNYTLHHEITDAGSAPVFMLHSGDIEITATRRASRPMLSLMSRLKLSYEDFEVMNDHRPPIGDARHLYWRYDVPDATPPYYHEFVPRRYIQALPQTYRVAGGTHITSTVSVMPMNGRAFNNNDAVDTAWLGNERLFQAKAGPNLGGAMAYCQCLKNGHRGNSDYILGYRLGPAGPSRLTYILSGGGRAYDVSHDYPTSEWMADEASFLARVGALILAVEDYRPGDTVTAYPVWQENADWTTWPDYGYFASDDPFPPYVYERDTFPGPDIPIP